MSALPTAARRPTAIAVRSIGGSERWGPIHLSVSEGKENRSARPTRIGGFAKGARRVKRKSDDSRRRLRQIYFFFFEDFFAFFFAGISGSPPPGHALKVI